MYFFNDIKGMRFGKLYVLEKTDKRRGRSILWKCLCDCGNITYVDSYSLKSGNTKSCGCGKTEGHPKYGDTSIKNNPIYHIWQGMRDRCSRKKNKSYSYYGGRGIKVCEEWQNSFLSFMNWAIANGYKKNLTIERIDNNGNYCPENCTFATMKQQSNNRRNGAYFSYNGETHTISEWSDILGVKQSLLRYRLWKGMPFQKAISKEDLRTKKWKL